MNTKVLLATNADLRPDANRNAWPMQQAMEETLSAHLARLGVTVSRAHAFDSEKGHGFIDSQAFGMQVFRTIDPDAPLIIALSTWQYSHHILHGLLRHRGPILTVANFSGTWPGLVGLLNLNACLLKAGVAYSSLWSVDFTDSFFTDGIRQWLKYGAVKHDGSHVRRPQEKERNSDAWLTGRSVGAALKSRMAILGVFDEGCMGMYNAIIPDALLNGTGLFKERLSQSALYHETRLVADAEARALRSWLDERGLTFHTGDRPDVDLTDDQIHQQLKMYVAALRLADDFGCAAIGIQYQQGLKDLLPASDLAEGLLNSSDRPPVLSRDDSRELFAGGPLPHFNEVDECAGVDALVTNRVWRKLGLDPATTLHDVRWGEQFGDDFVWVFEISGAAPVEHLDGGYSGASSMRQLPMYFRLGGGTLRGVSKPGYFVWSRVYVTPTELCVDLGIGRALSLPEEETERRWRATNYEWPIMHAVIEGVTRDQFMAKHPSNHVQVAYADSADGARTALLAKAGAFEAIGISVNLCGV